MTTPVPRLQRSYRSGYCLVGGFTEIANSHEDFASIKWGYKKKLAGASKVTLDSLFFFQRLMVPNDHL